MSIEHQDFALTLSDDNVTAVVEVLCDSFRDYPVMRYILESETRDYDAALQTMIGFFVLARVFRREYLFGVPGADGLAAAAIVSRSDSAPPPPEFYELRQRVWTELGSEAEARYDIFGQAWALLQIDEPHIHLNMIGVRGSAQRRGLGRMLLDRVHQLSASDSSSRGVSLNTELEANVALYEHFGYKRVGETVVEPGLTTWAFYRPD